MKIITYLLSIACLLCISFNVDAQSFTCGTDQSDAFMKDLMRNKKDFAKTAQKGVVERFVPVQFHNVGDNLGNERLNDEEIFRTLCLLNEHYDSLEMRFFLADDIRYLDNDLIFNDPRNNSASNTMRALKNNSAINVFVIKDPGNGAAGFYSGGQNDYIVMGKNWVPSNNYTIEHELGHFFTLSHTHRGWEDEPYDPMIHGDTVRITEISSAQTSAIGVEVMDMSNCGKEIDGSPIAGDGICDTPPDYGFGQGCNCCNFFYNVWDSNFDKIEMPSMNNVMSYSGGCDEWVFTAEQSLAIKTSYDSNRRAYIRNHNQSEYTPITEPTILLEPANLEMVETYDGILFTWEPTPNAEGYRINFSGSGELVYYTDEPELYVTDLKKKANYIWQVTALNKFGSGCVTPSSRLVFTGENSVAVNEISFVEDLNIYPNPASKNQNIIIEFSSAKNIDAEVLIYDMQGKLVKSIPSQNIQSGTNKIAVPSSGLNTGLYFMELNSTEGSIIEKIIIE